MKLYCFVDRFLVLGRGEIRGRVVFYGSMSFEVFVILFRKRLVYLDFYNLV